MADTARPGADRGRPEDVDAVVVGAGFAGLYMLYRHRGQGLSTRVVEKGDDVGGTWYWNRYPGARCDSDSHVYCYPFSEELLAEWEWSERYPEGSELLDYTRFATDCLALRRDVEFETTVESAAFDEGTGTWTVATDDGERVLARYFVTAVGCLSTPYAPDFEGITGTGIRTADAGYEFDLLVLATGFDAMTGTLHRMGIPGRDGQSLEDAWAEGPWTYLGVAVPGFPNMFTVAGPQSPSVLTNMPPPIEQHVEWIADRVSTWRAATPNSSTRRRTRLRDARGGRPVERA